MEPLKTDEERRSEAETQIWQILGTMWHRRWLITLVTGGMAVLSVVISLTLPNYYRAGSRLLLPESGGGGLASAILGNLGSAAQSLLGSSGGDYVRYLAILQSRNVLESVVNEFDLIAVYEYQDSDTPMDDAIKDLGDLVELYVDNEYDFLSIEVVDKDPQRAADIANFMVGELDRVNNILATQTAGTFRQYVQTRYDESRRERGVLLDSLRAFQQRYGVFDMKAQTEAFFDQIANLRVTVLEAEIQYEAMRSQLGDTNTNVVALAAVVEAGNRKYLAALDGREQVLPVATRDVPDVVRAYLDFEMERAIQEKILEFVAPMLEQARFEEQRTKESVQIVDPAIAPVKKDSPKRSIIVVSATLSAFILVVLYVLVMAWWQRNSTYFARQLREASETAAGG